jgi:hypothetical protein
MSFQPGDLVSLKTSSMPMTVERIEGEDVWCVRQDRKGDIQRERFNVVVLKKYERRTSIPIYRV